jgi:aspartate aminotransferase
MGVSLRSRPVQPAELPINERVRGLRKSPTIAINERCEALTQAGQEVFRLGLGHSPFPVPSVVVDALRDHAPRKEYLPTQGLPALREAVADYHRRRHGTACSADDVLIGPGSKELMFLLQLVYRGDLLVPTPAWVSYAPQARIVGRRVFFLHARAEQGWKLDVRQLEELCLRAPHRPRILVLNYPSNPTGGTYSAGELEQFAEVAARFGIVVLSDEIYGELHHGGGHVSIERVYSHGTIVSGGLSKWCGAGGWRLGTFAFPPALRWLLDAMAAVASETYTSTSAPIQYAAVRAFQGGIEMERYLWRARRILGALGRACAQRLRESGVRVADPIGAFYLFPDFSAHAEALRARGISTSEQLCERLLEETGVAILPGSDFGRPAAELTVRLAYVDFDGSQALAAAETLALDEPIGTEFLERYCSRTLAAVERLGKWMDH